MNNSKITYIQSLESKLGLKVTADSDLLKMSESSIKSYVDYLEGLNEAESGSNNNQLN